MLLILTLRNQKQVNCFLGQPRSKTKQNKTKIPPWLLSKTNKQTKPEAAFLQSQPWKGENSLASQPRLLRNFQAREIPCLIKQWTVYEQ